MKLILLTGALIPLSLLGQEHRADTSATYHLEEIAVVGTRASKTTPVSYTNIPKDALRRVNLGQDVPYLLQLQPSVVATSDAGTGIGYTSIRVRGVSATGVNISTNGVPMNDSESQSVFWVNMPDLTSSVEEMQLQRGVGTSSHGAGAFGASLNMRTSNLSTERYGELALSGGSYSTLRRSVALGTGTLGGHWAVDARLSHIKSHGYVDRSGVDLTSYFIQGGYFAGKTLVKLLVFGGKEVTEIAWHGISPKNEARYGRRYNEAGDLLSGGVPAQRYYTNTDNYSQRHHHLIVTQRLGAQLSLNVTGHYTAGYGYTDEYRTGRKLKEYGLSEYVDASGRTVKKSALIRRKYLDNDFVGLITQLDWHPEHGQLVFGMSGNYYKGRHYGEVRWLEHYPTPVHPEDRYYDGDAYKTDLSTYLKASYHITPDLSAYIDLQYRHLRYRLGGTYDGYSDRLGAMQQLALDARHHFVNPKAGLFWRFARKHHAYASIGIAHREPNRKMYTDAADASVYPSPERLTDYELGYGYRSAHLDLSANVYYMKYRDQLIMNGKWSDVGEALLENVPNSYRLGLELTGSYRPFRNLRLEGSLSLSRNKIDRYRYTYAVYDAHLNWLRTEEIEHRGVDIAMSPSIMASGMLTWTYRDLEASLTAQAVGRQYLDNTESATRQLPAYHTLGFRLGYRIPLRRLVRDWRVTLLINNLLDRRYYSNGYVYDMGIYADGTPAFDDLRYFPQAGINFLLGTTLRF